MPLPKNNDELDKLEEQIRVVKNKYDQFFAGIGKMPPWTERRAVDIAIYEMNKQKIRDNGRRFRLNTLTFEQLSAMVEKQSEMVRSRYNVNTVAFRVETVDGKVKLKAKPLQE